MYIIIIRNQLYLHNTRGVFIFGKAPIKCLPLTFGIIQFNTLRSVLEFMQYDLILGNKDCLP